MAQIDNTDISCFSELLTDMRRQLPELTVLVTGPEGDYKTQTIREKAAMINGVVSYYAEKKVLPDDYFVDKVGNGMHVICLAADRFSRTNPEVAPICAVIRKLQERLAPYLKYRFTREPRALSPAYSQTN